jgi:squalene-hopene/tetraprenyl-beta-curcumene cyclase
MIRGCCGSPLSVRLPVLLPPDSKGMCLIMIRSSQATALVVSATLLSLVACSRPQRTVPKSWDAKAAALYLDQRELAWRNWPSAARDRGTFCISCHTVMPYVLSRPTLRAAVAEPVPTEDEVKILANVSQRVRLWSQTEPYYQDVHYGDGKPTESRGTEAVLNALILANHDAPEQKLSPDTETAFRNMWALQRSEGEAKGSWAWLSFEMEPWEANDSAYYGAALAAIAVGTAPENYRTRPEIQPQLSLLRVYLNRESKKQSPINRVVLLWAGVKLPGLVDAETRTAIINEIRNEQRSDGGWELSSLSWPNDGSLASLIRSHLRLDGSRQDARSDGYATALSTFVLGQAGLSANDATLRQGLAWLAQNENSDGSWPSLSLTKKRDPSSMPGHFMRDAATAYAVLALTENRVSFKTESSNLTPLLQPAAQPTSKSRTGRER